MLTQKLWTMAQIGAEWVLYLLIFLSFCSIMITLERCFFFLKHRIHLNAFLLRLRAKLHHGGPEEAIRDFKDEQGPQGIVLIQALERAKDGADAVEEIATGARSQQKLRLEQGLTFLGTLGNNAPFIGLFGTVLGIINAFRELGHSELQQAGPKIMGAISEALIATAVGLMVAIPAVIAFNFFQTQAKRVLVQVDALIHELQAYLKRSEELDLTFSPPQSFHNKD